jgi:hypothetical protein
MQGEEIGPGLLELECSGEILAALDALPDPNEPNNLDEPSEPPATP